MNAAPLGARCRRHENDDAESICTRCGGFMCHECSNRGCDERCPDCRPRYGKAELDERRLNRVQRSPMVRCGACGFEGPRFDSVEPTSWKMFLAVLLLGACTLGFGALIVVLSVIGQRKPVCTGCGRGDALEPSKAIDLPRPANWDVLVAARRRTVRGNFLKLLPLVGVALVAAVVVIMGYYD